MKLVELQEILGETIYQIRDEKLSDEERKQKAVVADNVARLAKQMINNADIMLRADRLIADGKSIENLEKVL